MNITKTPTCGAKRGIYAIINKTTGLKYIGSTVDFTTREYQHWSDLSLNIHANKELQRVYNIKGKNNFVFIILEERMDLSAPELIYLENEYITKMGHYNKKPAVFSGNHGRDHELECLIVKGL